MAYSSEDFTYLKDERAFTTFASDLQINAYNRYAITLGFEMQSARTGVIAKFVLVKELYDSTGEELQGWEFKCKEHNVTATIWND